MNRYQETASKFYRGPEDFILMMSYLGLKLAGEAGEVAENLGKAIRDDGFGSVMQELTGEREQKIKAELGDQLWYIAKIARSLGFTLGEIAYANLDKLYDRQERGVLHGSGDDR